MDEYVSLNNSWFGRLTNPNHDGITQQVDNSVMAFVTDNALFIERRNALHRCREHEDEVWLSVQRDPVVKRLADADKEQDGYITAARYSILAHVSLPDGEPTKQEAEECNQVFKDFKFSVDNGYGAEADKIIQMQQNFAAHESFLTQIGAWTFLGKAVEKAHLVRELLLERAQTEGEFVKGEMKTARAATDQAIAELYRIIDAMMALMPSAELKALYTRLKGLEIYAKKYNLPGGSSGSSSGSGSGSGSGGGSTDQGGDTPSGDDTPSGGDTPSGDEPSGGTPSGGDTPSGGGDTPTPTPDPGGDGGDDSGTPGED